MIILAIDPGFERLGVAVIEKTKQGKEILLFSDCITTSRDLKYEDRLKILGQKIKSVISEFRPKALAIEKLFFTTNQKTVMQVAEARGIILYEASQNNLEIFEFSPPQIKLAVCGNGKADKKSIIKMVPLLIKLNKSIKHDDEYDAIAIGITLFAVEGRKLFSTHI